MSPTHSLLNYAQWHIVSPESSLAQLKGCDGYIAQVWTGTFPLPPNGLSRKNSANRTFETAFLEYGAMQNLVRSTGRHGLVFERPDRGQTPIMIGMIIAGTGSRRWSPPCFQTRSFGVTKSPHGPNGFLGRRYPATRPG